MKFVGFLIHLIYILSILYLFMNNYKSILLFNYIMYSIVALHFVSHFPLKYYIYIYYIIKYIPLLSKCQFLLEKYLLY